MTKKLDPSEMPGWPAALNQRLAAAYCGISVDVFVEKCPVKPIAITNSASGYRYLRHRLDEWLNSMDSPQAPKRIGMSRASITAMPPRSSRSRASRPPVSRRIGAPSCW